MDMMNCQVEVNANAHIQPPGHYFTLEDCCFTFVQVSVVRVESNDLKRLSS